MLSVDFLSPTAGTLEKQDFVAVALTGTKEKFDSLLDIIKSGAGQTFIPGILGCFQFEDAGKAPEPVTPDCVHLMLGKQEGQRRILLERFGDDQELRDTYNGKTLLLSSNDINTTIEKTPLTKAVLQKESKMDIFEYSDLITASLKYLAMARAGEKINFTWKQMQSDWKLVRKCLDKPWQDRTFLPIVYQSIDAFDLETLSVSDKIPLLSKSGPTIAIINKAYATLELDFRGGNTLVKEIIDTYLHNNWSKPDFTPDRYPLGIRQNELLKSFAKAGQHVLISDHVEYNGINLRDVDQADERPMLDTLNRIETMMNGFNQNSVEIAKNKYANMKPHEKNYLFVVKRKPGIVDRVERMSLPRWQH